MLHNLECRPIMAGVALGLLTYKPHLAFMGFAALAIGRHWRALIAAVACAIAFAAASAIAFGPQIWTAFLHGLPATRTLLERGQLPWDRMVSVFGAARLLGLGVPASYALQAAAALAALLALWLLWKPGALLTLRRSALIAGTLLATPFAYDYDLALLVIPVFSLATEAWPASIRRARILLLATLWVSPAVALVAAWQVHVQLMPLVLMLLLGAMLLTSIAGGTSAAENLKPSRDDRLSHRRLIH
jgi:hypothetical protein